LAARSFQADRSLVTALFFARLQQVHNFGESTDLDVRVGGSALPIGRNRGTQTGAFGFALWRDRAAPYVRRAPAFRRNRAPRRLAMVSIASLASPSQIRNGKIGPL
jgi:hypothetical protein